AGVEGGGRPLSPGEIPVGRQVERPDQEAVIVVLEARIAGQGEIIAAGTEQAPAKIKTGAAGRLAMNGGVAVATPGVKGAGADGGADVLALGTRALAGDDVDHAANGVGAILRRMGTAGDLDPLD